MKQNTVQQFISACGKAIIYVENDMPIGAFHDLLTIVKGAMVERMIAAQKAHELEIESQKDLPPHQSEIEANPDQEQPAPCESSCTSE